MPLAEIVNDVDWNFEKIKIQSGVNFQFNERRKRKKMSVLVRRETVQNFGEVLD